MAAMNTLILEKPEQFRFTQTDEPPAPPPAGFALVRVHRVGICGTDWHAYRGRQPFFTYPRILGHELGVVVEQVNLSGMSYQPMDSETDSHGLVARATVDLKPGDQCSVEPYMNCGTCIACRR